HVPYAPYWQVRTDRQNRISHNDINLIWKKQYPDTLLGKRVQAAEVASYNYPKWPNRDSVLLQKNEAYRQFLDSCHPFLILSKATGDYDTSEIKTVLSDHHLHLLQFSKDKYSIFWQISSLRSDSRFACFPTTVVLHI